MAIQGRDEFWEPRTADEVATAQGITVPQSLDRLFGAAADLWENDEEFEQFIDAIDRRRREPTST